MSGREGRDELNMNGRKYSQTVTHSSFFVSVASICYYHFQTSERWPKLQLYTFSLYDLIFPCSITTRYHHTNLVYNVSNDNRTRDPTIHADQDRTCLKFDCHYVLVIS
jgi:hypothetical protein